MTPLTFLSSAAVGFINHWYAGLEKDDLWSKSRMKFRTALWLLRNKQLSLCSVSAMNRRDGKCDSEYEAKITLDHNFTVNVIVK